MKFIQLFETFNNPEQIKWSENKFRIKGVFFVNKEKYVIKAIKLKNADKLSLYFKFYWHDIDLISTIRGNVKGKFKIISTVLSGVKYIVNTFNPDSFTFGVNLNEDSRIPLYNQLIEDNNNRYVLYKFNAETSDGHVRFYVLYKHNNLESIIDSLIKLSKEGDFSKIKYI